MVLIPFEFGSWIEAGSLIEAGLLIGAVSRMRLSDFERVQYMFFYNNFDNL